MVQVFLMKGESNKKMKNDEVKEKLVSIIMPAYNCEDFISSSLDSVIAQTYKNWEIIVVDDCSTDQTATIVNHYRNIDDRIKYFKLEKNSGAATARNTGTTIAKGSYIAFLDSDDLWFSEKLTKQIHFMEKNGFNFTCTSYTKINETGEYLGGVVKAWKQLDYIGVLKYSAGNSTVIYNSESLGKFIIPIIKKRNDYVMFLQIIKKEKYLHGIDEPLGSHRIRVGSISSNKFSLLKYHWTVYRKLENLSLIKSSYLLLHWVLRTVLKLNITKIKEQKALV